MRRWRPNLSDFVELSDDTVRTEFLKLKAARLASTRVEGIPRVIYRPEESTASYQVFTVRGDTDPRHPYTVWLAPNRQPWAAACSRGGVHDMQRDGDACSHGLAAAAVWMLMNDREDTPIELLQQAAKTLPTA